MASKYWIKLYHEIVDDPKMGQLPDHLWRRCIELFLIAGEHNQSGKLPDLSDTAWRLRTNGEMLEAELNDLARFGITNLVNGHWRVTNFTDRQGKPYSMHPDAVRQREYRAKKKAESVKKEDTDKETDTDMSRDMSRDKVSQPPVFIVPSILQTDEFEIAWNKWLTHLEEKSKTVSVTQASAVLEELAGWGYKRALAAVRHSTKKGWLHIREPKPNSRPYDPTPDDRQWALIQGEMSRVGAKGKPDLPDEALKAVKLAGGWSNLCYMNLHAAEKAFRSIFAEVSYG